MSKQLFDLIHSLTSSEHISFIKNMKGVISNRDYMLIYKKIQNMKEYSENEIKKIKLNQINNLSVKKNYLRKLIFKQMRLHHSNSSPRLKIYNMICDIIWLKEKELHDQAWKLIQKAKKVCSLYEEFYSLNILYELELSVIEAGPKGLSNFYLKEIQKLLSENAQRLRNRAMFLDQKLNGFRNYIGNDIKNKPLQIISLNEPKGFYDTFEYYDILFLEADMNENFKTCLIYLEKKLDLLTKHKHMLKIHPEWYFNILYNHANILAKQDSPDFILWIERAEKFIINKEKDFNVKTKIYQRHRLYTLLLSEKKLSQSHIQKVQDFIQNWGNKLNLIKRIELNYFLASYYIYNNQLEKALEVINSVINIKPNKQDLVQKYYSYTLILNIIVHFDLDNIIYLRNLLRNTNRTLSMGNRLYEFEKYFLSFFRRYIGRIRNNKDDLNHFKTLKKNLLRIFKDPLQANILKAFDYITWVESKIQKKPFSDFINFKRNNQNIRN